MRPVTELIIDSLPDVYTNDYANERDFEDDIELNLKELICELTNEVVVEYKRQFNISKAKTNSYRYSKSRVDFWVKTDKAVYLLELKVPQTELENIAGITQLLFYKEKYDFMFKQDCKLIYLTTKHSMFIANLIEKYKYPLSYSVIKKGGRVYTYKYMLKNA